MSLSLRPYQSEALDAVAAATERGVTRPLIALPTGCGKTVIFGHLVAEIVRQGGSALILAHRDELLTQAEEKLVMLAPELALAVGRVQAGRNDVGSQVVMASVQTLANEKRLAQLPSYFDIVVVDEAHHATAASYVRILDAIDSPLKLGVTATPERHDKSRLADIFEEIVFARSLLQMIEDGYLSNLRGLRVELQDLDLSQVKVSRGEYQTDDLARALTDAHAPEHTAAALAEHAAERKSIVFVPTVELAHATAEAISAAGIPAGAVWGDMDSDDRKRTLERLVTGELRAVTNVDVLCLDAETEILTDDGWAGPDEITPEHRVANWADGRVHFEKPRAIVKRERAEGEQMVALGGRGFTRNLRVTGNHRMVYRWQQGDWRKAPAADLVGRGGIGLPAHGLAEPLPLMPDQPKPLTDAQRKRRISASAHNLRKGGLGWDESFAEAGRRLDARQALRFKSPTELTADECRFIGFWVGDGSRTELQSGGVEYKLAQSKVYPAIIGWIDALLDRLEVDVVRREPGYTAVPCVLWSLSRGTGFGPQQRRGLFALEPYLNKTGSRLLWGLNEEQFDAFLEGWWYADGFHGDGKCQPTTRLISNVDYDLLSHVQAIAAARGYTTNLRKFGRPRKANHRQLWALSLRKGGDHWLGARQAMRAEDDVTDETVWCVTTTSGNIVTRRRGAVVVTGNSEGFDEPSVDCVVIAAPTRSRIAYVQRVGRGTRLHPGKDDCLVLDLVGVTDELKLQSLPDLFGLDAPPKKGERVTDAVEREAGEKAATEAERREVEARKRKARDADLFGRDRLHWIHIDERWVLPAGGDEALILDPLIVDGREQWRVLLLAKDRARILARNLDLGYAQGAAEEAVRRRQAVALADTQAAWRERPASAKQHNLCKRLGVDVPADATAGDVSDAITAFDVRKRLERFDRAMASREPVAA